MKNIKVKSWRGGGQTDFRGGSINLILSEFIALLELK
jgi:hypothetical protein